MCIFVSVFINKIAQERCEESSHKFSEFCRSLATQVVHKSLLHQPTPALIYT